MKDHDVKSENADHIENPNSTKTHVDVNASQEAIEIEIGKKLQPLNNDLQGTSISHSKIKVADSDSSSAWMVALVLVSVAALLGLAVAGYLRFRKQQESFSNDDLIQV